MNESEDYKEQLRIPLTEEEVQNLYNGDHVKVTFSDDSPHEDMILFKDGGGD